MAKIHGTLAAKFAGQSAVRFLKNQTDEIFVRKVNVLTGVTHGIYQAGVG